MNSPKNGRFGDLLKVAVRASHSMICYVQYSNSNGHVADSQYIFCSVALGEKNPLPKIE
jgi:hypothetical protein